MIKTNTKLRMERNYLNVIKTIKEKSTVNIMVLKTEIFSSKSGIKQEGLLFQLLVTIVLEVLDPAIGQGIISVSP